MRPSQTKSNGAAIASASSQRLFQPPVRQATFGCGIPQDTPGAFPGPARSATFSGSVDGMDLSPAYSTLSPIDTAPRPPPKDWTTPPLTPGSSGRPSGDSHSVPLTPTSPQNSAHTHQTSEFAAYETPAPPVAASVPSLAPVVRRERPAALTKVSNVADGKKPIGGTFYLDPCLRNVLFNVPHQISASANAALTGLGAYPDDSFNWTTGAPINGIAKLAKRYILPPDANFESENGAITIGLAVVDEVGGGVIEEPAEEGDPKGKGKAKVKKRTNARVQVSSNRGGVEIDIIEIDPNRQLDLTVETAAGDVLVLLPETFMGPINVAAPEAPNWGPALMPMVDKVVSPYEGLFTTVVVPMATRQAAAASTNNKQRGPRFKSTMEHGLMKKIAHYVPDMLREQDDYLDMVMGGYAAFSRTNHSKLHIKSEKGCVMIGYRATADREKVKELGMRVGLGSKPKSWWKSL